ncbi:Ubiquinone/menaquinone biosynthesis C-methyltransferase UbiE [uncultured archaeon]|nr:Ubiquinone/menaquinone biosynthesis C-methyltransferase UbiE [uncultured archaeon]
MAEDTESMKEVYARLDADYFKNSLHSVNPIVRGYHCHRHAMIRKWISQAGPNPSILDIGCGSCEWNTDKLPVMGLDLSPGPMEQGQRAGRLSKSVRSDFEKGLPFPDASFDVVVLGEVLEHVARPPALLGEIRRVLKAGGRLLITVPYDAPVTLHYLLFPLQCFYMGWIRNVEFYRHFCGHINHYSPATLRRTLRDSGFEEQETATWNLLGICMLALKPKKS